MRILCVNFSGGWGGLEMFSGDLFELLGAAGHDARFLLDGDTPLAERLEAEGHGERLVRLRPSKYLDRGCRRAIRELVRAHDIQVVHTFRSADIFHPALALRGRREQSVRLVHHLQMLPGHARRDLFHRFVYRRLDRVYAITDQIRDRVRELWPVPPDRVRTVHYGIDPVPFEEADRDAARERLGIAPDAIALGVVGQICEIKGQRFVLEAFAELAPERPELVLALVGAPVPDDPGYARGLEEFARERGLAERVLLPGFQADVPGVMSALDVFVLGSRQEPFGRVVIEAMAAGAVTVASRAGGVPEIVTDGVDGLLYEPRDAADLHRALLRALDAAPEARAELVARGRETVQQRFSPARFRACMGAEYADVVGEPVDLEPRGAAPPLEVEG